MPVWKYKMLGTRQSIYLLSTRIASTSFNSALHHKMLKQHSSSMFVKTKSWLDSTNEDFTLLYHFIRTKNDTLMSMQLYFNSVKRLLFLMFISWFPCALYCEHLWVSHFTTECFMLLHPACSSCYFQSLFRGLFRIVSLNYE